MVRSPKLRRRYRELIDALVDEVRTGQGDITAGRARAAKLEGILDGAPPFKALLKRLSARDRQVVGEMLRDAFAGGIHTTLVALHEREFPPFEDGYEGTPFHDFVGRLSDWEWPEH